MKPIARPIIFFSLLLLAACRNPKSSSSMNPENQRKESFIETHDVKLQYLDWGGQGEVLVLICGLGDTPFLFDSLARELSPNFHIIGYSRRNHGKSRAIDEKYDNATLVSDLKLLLDSLKIDKANLLGWSMGGNEITEFASLYPDRVGKLIYFEAGYDLSDGGFEKLLKNMPKPYLPDSSIMQSLENYRKWYHQFWFGDVEWNDALEANLQASVVVKPNGSIATIPNDDVFKSTLKEAMKYRRTYQRVQAPSLVIYTKSFFHPADNSAATAAVYDTIENRIVSPWRYANRRRIENELQNAIIVDAPGGSHTSFLFLSNTFLATSITSFLDKKR